MADPLHSSASPAERAAAGKAARSQAPRSSHGEWKPAGDRPDPVELLESQATSRVGQLVPLRYGRMLVSPFTFYRGAAAVMAADLAGTARSGFDVQLCGDAHLSNFGAYASPDRELVFDVNDFDETLPGPWEWDVMRLAASFSVAGRERGFKRRERLADRRRDGRRVPRRRCSGWPVSATSRSGTRRWTWRRSPGAGSLPPARRRSATFRRNLEKTRAKDRMRALSKLTREVDGQAAHRQRTAADRAARRAGRRGRRHRSHGAEDHRRLPRHASRGPPRPARRLPLRRRGAQGGRRRQRRHPRLHRADAGTRRWRPALPPGQGSAALRARALRGAERLRQPGRARRPGPAPRPRPPATSCSAGSR